MKQIGIKIGLILATAIFIASGWYLLAPYFLTTPPDATIEKAPRFVFPAKAELGMIMPPQTIGEAVAVRLKQAPLGGDDATTTAAAIHAALEAAPAITSTAAITPSHPSFTPTIIAQGQFVDGDIFHKGSGTATIWQTTPDSYVLRLTNFRTTVGPDLRVLLSPASAPASHARLGDYIEIDMLKGNLGDQEYTLPADFDPTAYGSVVIYCVPFRVIFATATLHE